MKRFTGIERVPQGMYFNIKRCLLVSVADGACLPGTKKDTYRRVPQWLFFVIGPLLGLAFIIFLPILGFVFFGIFFAQKLAFVFRGIGAACVRVLSPAWEPFQAFLHRSPSRRRVTKMKKDAAPPAEDPWLKKMKEKLGHFREEDDNSLS